MYIDFVLSFRDNDQASKAKKVMEAANLYVEQVNNQLALGGMSWESSAKMVLALKEFMEEE